MKLIAHRGWSAGGDENSLAAFARSAADPEVSGVEFDVRRSRAGGLVVSHDAPAAGDEPLALDSALAFLAGTDLALFVELKEPGIAPAVLDLLRARDLEARTTVFAFAELAPSIPWAEPRRPRLGLVVRHPWRIPETVHRYRPDVVLLGWDYRAWTRLAFRAWWSISSLSAMGERASAAVVVGIAQRPDDLRWLRRQGIEAAVAEMGALRAYDARGGQRAVRAACRCAARAAALGRGSAATDVDAPPEPGEGIT